MNRFFETAIRFDLTGVPIDIILSDEVHLMGLSIYREAQQAYLRDIAIAGISAIVIIGLFIIQLLGAGRRYGEPKDIYFIVPKKPLLDLSLAAVIGWTVASLVVVHEISWPFMREINSQTIMLMNIIIAVTCVLIFTPILLWTLSLVKHIKAGQFWKQTLIYAIPAWTIKKTRRLIKTFWLGRTLGIKILIIIAGIFFVLIIVGMGAASARGGFTLFLVLLVTVGTSTLISRYATRLHRLETGAKAVCGGKYDEAIVVGGGELGSIAASINNIGEGIHNAVEERMKSERLKTELITNVSHDIRTPLTSIITYTDLLKHEGLDCEKAPEYLDILVQKSQRLKTLTDELFEAAKAATGNIEVNITKLDIVSLINQVMGEMDSAISSSELEIRFNHPEHLHVKGDGRLMWRVMENLLTNVIKYALPKSRVYLEVLEMQPPYSCILLKNISANELNVQPSELTERFKRGDESRTEGGSGLGLSIVQSFIEAQNGKFEIAIDGDLFKATIWLPKAE